MEQKWCTFGILHQLKKSPSASAKTCKACKLEVSLRERLTFVP